MAYCFFFKGKGKMDCVGAAVLEMYNGIRDLGVPELAELKTAAKML